MKNYIGKKVIVRADRAGVFYGELKEKEGNEVQLVNARKLYYWNGANAVEQIALEGVNKPEDCQFTVTLEEMTVMGVIQLLPCTDKAITNIENVKEWKR